MHLASLGLDSASPPALGTIDLREMFRRKVTGPGRLNHAAQLLTNVVSWQFDLIVVRCPFTLLHRLQPSRDLGSFFQQISQFLFQSNLSRIHANLRES